MRVDLFLQRLVALRQTGGELFDQAGAAQECARKAKIQATYTRTIAVRKRMNLKQTREDHQAARTVQKEV